MKGFGSVPKSDFLVSGTPPAPKPSAGAAEPSHETAEPSADPARPNSETVKPRPAHGDRHFLSKPKPNPASPIYGDSAASSKPGATDTKPSTETTKPSADIVKPNRASRARGGSQEHSCAVLGFGVSMPKPQEAILDPGGGKLRTAKPKLSSRFR